MRFIQWLLMTLPPLYCWYKGPKRMTLPLVLFQDPAATLDDLREAVATLAETERIARRVFGGTHPLTVAVGRNLREARAALAARETPSPGSA